nr:DNA mismatch endonuclease Vsr [Pedobacter sp. JY14-1]
MSDIHSKEIRSFNMSRIRSKDTRPEMLVRKYLHSKGFRYRIHDKNLPGKPDMVLPKYKTIIFINGCFWHRHEGCNLNRPPKENQDFWLPKLAKNVAKDKINYTLLSELGYTVITVWECTLKKSIREKTFDWLIAKLKYSK